MAPRLLNCRLVMQADQFIVRFWGVRGSVATVGPEFATVGGNTSCVEVRAGDEIVILDAGTGLFPLGQTMGTPARATFLFSHLHWDHIQGFPLFRPAYQPGNHFTVGGPGEGELGIEAALRRQMQPPHFPVPLTAMQADFDFRSIRPGDQIQLGRVSVRAAALHHPQGCLGYRISLGDHSVVYATDTEQLEDRLDPAVVALAEGADLLIYDSQYTEDEYHGRVGPGRKTWGHSTTAEACRVARAARVRQLALFHHDPAHDDAFIADAVREAQEWFPNTVAACEAMTLDLTTSATDQDRAYRWSDQVRQEHLPAVPFAPAG